MTTNQQPIRSGFTPFSTTADVIQGISLVGKVAIVTGGYAGLGLEAARTLASAGARVIVPARDIERATKAVMSIGGGIEIMPMDLTDPRSVSTFAKDFINTGLPLHILINSAGIMASPTLEQDTRGNEMQFSTNHLGHFQLTALLWSALKRADGARVVAVSSLGHRISDVVFDDINFERRAYDGWSAYGQSKTANILFAVELDRRGKQHGVRAFSLHPGGIVTNLAKHMDIKALQKAGNLDGEGKPIIDPARDMKSIPQGAATHVWCAVSPLLDGKGGVFCANSDIAPVLGENESPASVQPEKRYSGVMPYAINPYTAGRLWTLSEELTATRF